MCIGPVVGQAKADKRVWVLFVRYDFGLQTLSVDELFASLSERRQTDLLRKFFDCCILVCVGHVVSLQLVAWFPLSSGFFRRVFRVLVELYNRFDSILTVVVRTPFEAGLILTESDVTQCYSSQRRHDFNRNRYKSFPSR